MRRSFAVTLATWLLAASTGFAQNPAAPPKTANAAPSAASATGKVPSPGTNGTTAASDPAVSKGSGLPPVAGQTQAAAAQDDPQAVRTELPRLASITVAVVAIAFAGLACGLIVMSLKDKNLSEYAFRRHWGGFGGTTTGWQVSPALVQLVVGIVLAVLASSLLLYLMGLDTAEQKPLKAAASSATAPSVPASATSAPVAATPSTATVHSKR